MRELHTQIRIAAPPSRVFEMLTAFRRYRDWNPLIPEASGAAEPGAKVRIRITPPGAREQPYEVTVTRLQRDREFRWVGHLGPRGLLDGEHVFELQRTPDGGTLLIHREQFRGLLVPLLWPLFLNTKMRCGFELLNHSLKRALEYSDHA